MTSNETLKAWVGEVADLCTPDDVVWCDGSQQEYDDLSQLMVETGTYIRLDEQRRPNSYLCRSDPADVARVENRTFICSERESDAGPTNNWAEPSEMRQRLQGLLSGCMRGRTMYVIPYLMVPPGSPMAKVGVEITDSPCVVANMRIMTRMGQVAVDELGEDGDFVKVRRSTVNLEPEHRYIRHFPD